MYKYGNGIYRYEYYKLTRCYKICCASILKEEYNCHYHHTTSEKKNIYDLVCETIKLLCHKKEHGLTKYSPSGRFRRPFDVDLVTLKDT